MQYRDAVREWSHDNWATPFEYGPIVGCHGSPSCLILLGCVMTTEGRRRGETYGQHSRFGSIVPIYTSNDRPGPMPKSGDARGMKILAARLSLIACGVAALAALPVAAAATSN